MSLFDDHPPAMSLFDDHPSGKAAARQQARKKWKPASMREDPPWCAWEYGEEEWALFDRIDWGVRSLFFWGLLGTTLVLLLLGLILLRFLFLSDSVLALGVFVLAVLFFSLCLCLSMYHLPSYRAASRRHKARLHLPRTVLFSRNGVWEAGTFFPLHRGDVELAEVTLTSGPLVLHFRLRAFTWRDEGNEGFTYTTYMAPALDVLVPRGQQEEAGQLRERFQTEVITAREQEGLPLEERVFCWFSRAILWHTVAKQFDKSPEREGK